jgi:hypothetical protein
VLAARGVGYQWPEKLGPRLVEKSRQMGVLAAINARVATAAMATTSCPKSMPRKRVQQLLSRRSAAPGGRARLRRSDKVRGLPARAAPPGNCTDSSASRPVRLRGVSDRLRGARHWPHWRHWNAVKLPLTGWLDSSILWPGQPEAGQRSNRWSQLPCSAQPRWRRFNLRMLFRKICRSTKRNAT